MLKCDFNKSHFSMGVGFLMFSGGIEKQLQALMDLSLKEQFCTEFVISNDKFSTNAFKII